MSTTALLVIGGIAGAMLIVLILLLSGKLTV